MSKSEADFGDTHASDFADVNQSWTGHEREEWVSMAIAAATQSLRVPGFDAMNDGDEQSSVED